MNYVDELYKKAKWYISHEVLYFDVTGSGESKCLVWENLILIRADNPEEAYEKAIKNGKNSEEPVVINGINGHTRFKGLKDLVLIYDELEDGTELEWHEYEVKLEELDYIVKPKSDLHAFNPVKSDGS